MHSAQHQHHLSTKSIISIYCIREMVLEIVGFNPRGFGGHELQILGWGSNSVLHRIHNPQLSRQIDAAVGNNATESKKYKLRLSLQTNHVQQETKKKSN